MLESAPAGVLKDGAQKKGEQASCAVLVMSCDAYSDLWKPFFALLHQYWPECPFPVYLGTNWTAYDGRGVTSLLAGDGEWSERLRLCLEQIASDYVLLLLEDYFLDKPISTREILRHLDSLDELQGAMLRLYPRPGPDTRVPGNAQIGRIDVHAPYRMSTQPAIWHRAQLLRLIVDEESIWEFEWKGTVRSKQLRDGFYATWTKAFPFRHVLERGEWFWLAARHYQKQGIGCDFEARSVMSPWSGMVKTLNRLRKNTTNAVLPARLRRRK